MTNDKRGGTVTAKDIVTTTASAGAGVTSALMVNPSASPGVLAFAAVLAAIFPPILATMTEAGVRRMKTRADRFLTTIIDEWARDLAPSDELRRWFDHRPERFEEFKRRYTAELREHADQISALRRRAREGTVTLVYGARDADHSNAAVLAPIIRRGFPRESSV